MGELMSTLVLPCNRHVVCFVMRSPHFTVLAPCMSHHIVQQGEN